jgi:DNA polymerase elongation subunit (family B)
MLDKSILANLEQVKKNVLVFDLETSSHYPDGREVNIRSDFESYIKFAKMKWFGAYSYLHDKEYFYTKNQSQEIMTLLAEHNTLCGFNSEEFDFPILVNNGYVEVEKKYLHIDCKTILGTANFKNKQGYANKNRAALMEYKLKDNHLRTMAETMKLDFLKGNIDYTIFHKSSWTVEEEKEIIAYLRNDVMATKQLFDKLWEYWLPFAELLDIKDIYNLSWIRSSIASLTYKAACRVIGVEPTYSEKVSEAEDIGGNVFLPTVEEETGVWYVDFQSLYPHIFCQFNLPAEVNLDNISAKRKVWHGNEVFQVKGYYDITEQHPLSKYIASKLKERIALKDVDKNHPMVYTLKIFLNGLYGVMRSAIFEKVHTPNCGADCCFLGQQIQQLAKEMLEQFGFTVIAGDTDSLMIVTKDPNKNTRDYVVDCLNQIVEIIKDSVPYPSETFKIGIENYLDYILFPFEDATIVGEDGKNKKENGRLIYQRTAKKKNYLYVFTNPKGEKEVKLVGLPIKKDNSTLLAPKIYEEVLKPEIIKNNRAKFSKAFLDNIINEYLKKPEILQLLSQEYKVNAASSYKTNCIQKQISDAYFKGREGVIRLVKNSKVGKCGKGTLYATVEEVTNAKLTREELDLDKAEQELSPFILFEVGNTPVEATKQPKTTTSSSEIAKAGEILVKPKKPRGRPKKVVALDK